MRRLNVAFEAVIGVLGVLAMLRLGGGVSSRLSTSAEGAGKDAIREAVGVLIGSRLRGGRRKGWSDFFFTGVAGVTFSIGIAATVSAPIVRFLLCRGLSEASRDNFRVSFAAGGLAEGVPLGI